MASTAYQPLARDEVDEKAELIDNESGDARRWTVWAVVIMLIVIINALLVCFNLLAARYLLDHVALLHDVSSLPQPDPYIGLNK